MRQLKIAALLLIGVLFFRTGVALAGTTPEIDIPYKKFTLKNGLTVIIHEDHKAPIVAVNI